MNYTDICNLKKRDMHISLIHLRILDIASRCFKLTTIKHVCAVDFQMSNIVGTDIKPQGETSLFNMLEFGLAKHLGK